MKRMIVLTGLIALAGAQGVRADDAQQAREEASQEVREARQDAAKKTSEARKDAAEQTSEARQDAAKETREAQQDVKETQQEASQQVRDTQRDENRQASTSARGEQKKHAFEGKENFDVDGKVQRISGRNITIAREELPAVTLRIERYTAIELDGEKAARTQLKPGQDVQASFNLNGDKAVALELKAKKATQ
jgi:vacuolar-type H+-ATPase subunit H